MLLAGLLYFVTLGLFGFAIAACMLVPNDIWLVLCIFPAFIALILGFVMFMFAWGEYGPAVAVGSLVPPTAIVWLIRGRLPVRKLFVVICVAVLVGLLTARLAFLAADIG